MRGHTYLFLFAAVCLFFCWLLLPQVAMDTVGRLSMDLGMSLPITPLHLGPGEW